MNQLLDENCPSQYYWVLLNNEVDKDLPQLKFWSLYTPEDHSPSCLQENDPVRTFGMYLLESAKKDTQILDIYKQPVFLGQYNPNYMRVEQDFITNFKSGKTYSREESIINSIIFQEINPDKASFALWEYRLINAYRYLRTQAKENLFYNMSNYLWNDYLRKLMENITITGIRKSEERKNEPRSGLNLDRVSAWKKAGSWKYSDIVALCKLGIPRELRSRIWAELFGLSDANDPNSETKRAKDYEYYVNESRKRDSVIYRQIEEDVLNLPMNEENENANPNAQAKEKAYILKIAKAYYAWCIKQNETEIKTDTSKYAYFKGILYFIRKVWQAFEEAEVEVETFWCIIGFAQALPYLFRSQDVMIGKLSWNHKLLLLAITTIMEVKFPNIYNAILRHGLPIEYYISDKLFTMLSTVFPTDTLLRFYDIIALEAGSKESLRPMWVILSGCIMLMTLNEVYIKEARNADEIELVINNTGINKLNTQALVEEIYKLSNDLFSTYNPRWDKFKAVIMNINDSAVGMEYLWSKKAQELETRYEGIKKINTKIDQIMTNIRSLLSSHSSKENIDDTYWMDRFVSRFCKYYAECSSKELIGTIHIYVHRCCHIPKTDDELTIIYGEEERKFNIQAEGMVDDIAHFDCNKSDTVLHISVKGEKERTCTIDLSDYETDMPITLDKSLNLVGNIIPHNGQKPQPFISLGILTATKDEEEIDTKYKVLKKYIVAESVYIKPIQGVKSDKKANTMLTPKEKIKSDFQKANLKSIFSPEMKEEEENKESDHDNKTALLHLFSLVKNEEMSYVANDMPEAEPEISKVVDEIYEVFTKHYPGKLSLKRVIVSLIAAGHLTVDQKLTYLYTIYTSIAGTAASIKDSKAFLLDNIIELIQILCELHLVYIPPEYIPHLTEHIMTKGGVNRITNCYLTSSRATAENVLKQVNLKGVVDADDVVDVTEKVQKAFSRYWELWGYKLVFADDSSSFCATLNTVLGGYKGRPKSEGPYKLIICYKHNGQGYFKELQYNPDETLVINVKETKNPENILRNYKNNLTFVGERIRITCDEFIKRAKRIPLLTELMRLHISANNTFAAKKRKKLRVEVVVKGDLHAIVQFESSDSRDDYDEGDAENVPSPERKYDSSTKRRNITLYNLYNEDLLVEVKERVITEIRKMIEEDKEVDFKREIPLALNPEHLNQSLQLFSNDIPLNDFARLENTVRILITYSIIEQWC